MIRRIIIQISVLLITAAILALLQLAVQPSARALLTPAELMADEVRLEVASRWQPPPVWIDARPRVAFEKNHLPGAYFLTVDQEENFEQLLFEIDKTGVLDGSRPVVVYCSAASCQLSREVAQRLRERYSGLKVFVLHGGWPVI